MLLGMYKYKEKEKKSCKIIMMSLRHWWTIFTIGLSSAQFRNNLDVFKPMINHCLRKTILSIIYLIILLFTYLFLSKMQRLIIMNW